MNVRLTLACAITILFSASRLLALEAVGTVQRIDLNRGVVVVFANGQDRTLKIDKDLKVLDAQGKDLAAGLKSAELKAGVEVTVTVDRDGGVPILKILRLGKQAGAGRNPGGTATGGKTTVGFLPLDEMTADQNYKGEEGGLYGAGKNAPAEAHASAAKAETARIVPLDLAGQPAAEGKIVLVSLSMSNATQEFSTFKRIADADPDKSPQLTIVDCAQGGQAMAEWVPADARPWAEAQRRIRDAGVSAKQVQIAWIKLANKGPRGELAEHAKKLAADTTTVLHNARSQFPNLRIAYLGSRIYGGYAENALNPEPYAYEGAFAVRWLIRDQIKGEASLRYAGDGAKAPLLLWGPYLWADGTTPRKSDGLVWLRQDLAGDGTHPSDSGREKVARLLLGFFKTDPLAKTWFVKAGGQK